MKTSSRLVVAAAVAALGIGIAGPATAASHAAKAPGPAGKAMKAAPPKGKPTTKPTPMVDQVAVRQVLSTIGVLDARLAAAAQTSRTAGLSSDNLNALLANVAADRASLATIAASVKAATSPAVVTQAGATLKTVQPQVYTVAVNRFRAAQELAATIAGVRASYDDGTDGATALDGAAAQVEQAETLVRAVTARSTQSPLQNAQRLIDQAAATLEDVCSLADTTDGTTDPYAG